MNEVFTDKSDLLNYFLQIQSDDQDFYILKALEKPNAQPEQVSLNYTINEDFKIAAINARY